MRERYPNRQSRAMIFLPFALSDPRMGSRNADADPGQLPMLAGGYYSDVEDGGDGIWAMPSSGIPVLGELFGLRDGEYIALMARYRRTTRVDAISSTGRYSSLDLGH